jgi:hypothetical protein
MLQLHDRKVMEPKHAAELTHAQKQEALAYLMFLKRKRCGKIKARGGNANAKTLQRLRQRLHVRIFGLSGRRSAAQRRPQRPSPAAAVAAGASPTA